MKERTKDKINAALIYLVFLLFGIVIGLMLYFYLDNMYEHLVTKEKQVNYNCEGLSLTATSKCLENSLEKIYNYNITNKGKKLDEDELIKEGGVCSHYARWYINHINNSSFYTKYVVIEMNETTSHAFIVISNDEGYCILDQTQGVKCNYFA